MVDLDSLTDVGREVFELAELVQVPGCHTRTGITSRARPHAIPYWAWRVSQLWRGVAPGLDRDECGMVMLAMRLCSPEERLAACSVLELAELPCQALQSFLVANGRLPEASRAAAELGIFDAEGT